MGFRKRKGSDGPELPDEYGGGVKTITIDMDGTPVRLVQLNQLPVLRVIPVMSEEDPNKQMVLIMDLLKSALMDPADWDRCVSGISVEGLHKALGEWTKTIVGE